MTSGDSEYRCFVGGLAWATDEQSLERTFSQFGEILDSKIIIDRETGRSKGFGFVTFKDEEAMRGAIERMNGQELDGRNITVNEAQARGSRGGNGGGYSRGGGGGGGYGGRRDQGGYSQGGGDGYGGGGGCYGYGRREGGYGGGGYGDGGYSGRSDGGNWRN